MWRGYWQAAGRFANTLRGRGYWHFANTPLLSPAILADTPGFVTCHERMARRLSILHLSIETVWGMSGLS